MAEAPAARANTGRTLNYGPTPSARLGRRLRRVIVVLLVVAAALAAWRWHAPATRRASVLYWQGRAARYGAPAEQVVFDSDKDRVASLAPDSGLVATPTGGFRVAARPPPEPWQRLQALCGWTTGQPGPRAVLFLGERRAPAGEPRVVAVEFAAASWVPLTAYVVRPGALWTDPKLERGSIAAGVIPPGMALGQSLRLYAGQPDPADADRFTIRYEWNGQPGTIEGWLLADDGVSLRAIDGPLRR